MKIIIAAKGEFLATLKIHAGTSVAVLPHGTDWSPIVTSCDPFAELLQYPLEHFPIDLLE